MGSVPAYAAIAQTVELAKQRHGIGASKLANAVLRRVDRERNELTLPTLTDPVDALALTHSHPRWLVARWVARWGAAETRAAADREQHRAADRGAARTGSCASSSRRCSRTRASTSPRARSLRDSIQLPHGISLTELGAFRKGLFFVQDPGVDARHAVRGHSAGRARRRSLRGTRRQDARAVAHGVDRGRGRSQSESHAAAARESPPTGGAQHLVDRDGRAQSRRARDGRGAHRRAVHRHRHVPPPSRRALAASHLRPRGDGGAAAQHSARGGGRRAAGRAAHLQHLLARARGERRADRELPRRAQRLAARAAAGGRGARERARRRTPARAAAAHGVDGAFAARLRKVGG